MALEGRILSGGRSPMERKLAAILSADAQGYSRLMGDDEAATVHTITEYRETIASAVARHGGRVVDTPGDNVLAEFPSVVDAVQSAVEIQRELQSRNAALPASRRMQFRIGINLGDVIVETGRLYGDSVNIAARLEGLAESGGICLSGTAYDQVESKLPFGYDFLGEHTVKNITRPVRVYRLRLDASPRTLTVRRGGGRRLVLGSIGAFVVLILFGAGAWAGWRWLKTPTSAGRPALPNKPSVAVLPFTNLSRDPSQEYFNDGVTEDLITGLSKLSGLFVIARNSVFTYKGKAVKISDVARDLGVRYVLEGGVQRSGSRVRITAQLVDATTGYHIWAERYDREVRDIFALQDEVTQQIVRALAVKLTEGERGRIARVRTSPEVYDLVLRGSVERRRTTPDTNAESRRLFAKALDLDPTYAQAYVGLSWVHLQSWQLLWTTDRDVLERAQELVERAIALDDTLAAGHSLLGQIYLWKKDHDRAIAQAERAVALAPNDADGYETLAEVLAWSGRPDESIKVIRQAMRLNPHYPFFYLWTLGHASYIARRTDDAVDALSKTVQQNPNFLPAHAYLAVLFVETGREQEGRERLPKRLGPTASLASLQERLPYRRAADLDRFLTAAHKAGMR
jgi:adenylate cyclase